MHSYISGHYVVSVPWLLWILLPWTWKYRYLLEIIVAFPLYIYPEVGLLDHMVVLFSISWGTAILFSVVAVPVDISTNSVQVFSPHPSQHCCLFDKSHPNRCDMIVGFFFFFPICIFLMTSDVECVFMYLLAIYMSSLGKNV